ncbi:LysR family transcriptional regulator [Aestuariivivens sediminicola]|uniref:LysR family transcriptional regulator n=1 Tax=Aestuariivivens sediminicola TaxID=2913560 RepID=UPI001F59274F|nr:LysR family transcriptional regulator [Aestuariivivens sediminicola]
MITVSNQLELRHLNYFLAVAEDLHYRKAAERLFISQPGLSRQIKQMEEALGIQLFERHNRKVELTKAGLYLKQEITRNLKQLERIIAHARLLQDGIEGHLKLGYVGSAMQQIIPDLLLKFEADHPHILYSLKEMDNDRQIQALLTEDIDIGFVRLERIPDSIAARPVLKERFCLVLPEAHPVTETNFKHMKQLEKDAFILFDPNYSTSYYDKVMRIFQDAGFSPMVSHNTIHAGSIYKLVQNNFGVSIVPRSLTDENVKGVRFIELKKIPHKTTLSLVWNKGSRNPVLKQFLRNI